MKRILIFLLAALLLAGCGDRATREPASVIRGTGPTSTTTSAATTVPAPSSTATEPEAPDPPVPQGFDPAVYLDAMTLEEKVGQLFLACYVDNAVVNDISAGHLGGLALFAKDFQNQTVDSLVAAIENYQDAAAIPLLIAVDEEGGSVVRVSCYSQFRASAFHSPRWLYDQGGLELVLENEWEKCEMLASLGINVNLAPVCDITTDPSSFMYSRSLGQDPQVTGDYIARVVDLMNSLRMGGVLKHFPGYGNNTDTHIGIAWDERSLESLENVDLVPFAMGIQAGAGAIMVSHTFVTCLDDQLPATLSPAVHRYLREEMGFEGVIVTDDLAMGAITSQYGAAEAAVLAVLAGNDLLCTGFYRQQYQAVLEAVQSGRISEAIIDEAVARVLTWKYRLGLMG